jgi:hypothetical protein
MPPNKYTLYWHPYSISALMVRYTVETRGPPKDGEPDWTVETKVVNIFAGEQISEHFLCDVNPKGQVRISTSNCAENPDSSLTMYPPRLLLTLRAQVPVLTNPDILPKPLADSQDITLYITERFPRLLPRDLQDEILKGLAHLHEINYFTLTFTDKPNLMASLRSIAERDLADSNSSTRYKRALEYKLEV